MIAKNVTVEEMERSLKFVNSSYGDNIKWNRFEKKGKQIHFTLKPIDSKKAGSKRGIKFIDFDNGFEMGKRICACCWHVHGEFFDVLISVNKTAVIMSRGKRIDIHGGNWINFNVGSTLFPFLASESCECN